MIEDHPDVVLEPLPVITDPENVPESVLEEVSNGRGEDR